MQKHIPSSKKHELSRAQWRMLIAEKTGIGVSYNIVQAAKVAGELNTEKFEASVSKVIDRHEILRTIFVSDAEGTYQFIVDQIGSPVVRFHDVDEAVLSTRSTVENIIQGIQETQFDIQSGPLFGVDVFNTGTSFMMVISMHHLISDGWTIKLLSDEIEQFYIGKELSPVKFQYSQYVEHEANYLQSQQFDIEKCYWENALNEFPEPFLLPTRNKIDPLLESNLGQSYAFDLNAKVSSEMKEFCKQYEVTPYIFTLTVFSVLMCKIGGTKQGALGSVIMGRNTRNLYKTMGCIINTLPIRFDAVDLQGTFAALLRAVAVDVNDASANGQYPFDDIQKLHRVKHGHDGELFHILFNYIGAKSFARDDFAGMDFENIDINEKYSKLPLSIYLQATSNGTNIKFVSQKSVYNSDDIKFLADQYKQLILSLLNNPNQSIAELSLVTELNEDIIADPRRDLPSEKQPSVIDLFERQVRNDPNATAIQSGSQAMTYGALSRQVDAVAAGLINAGMQPGDVVGICYDRSENDIIAMLATLRAGGCFYMQPTIAPISDVSVKLWLNSVPNAQSGLCVRQLINADGRFENKNQGQGEYAYIVRTSGSTGTPKAILGTHSGLSHFIQWQISQFNIRPNAKFAQLTTPMFDVYLRDVLMPLCAGCSITLLDEHTRLSPEQLCQTLADNEISHLHFVPSLIKALLLGDRAIALPKMQYLFSAGEPLYQSLIEDWRKRVNPDTTIVNFYGPSETTLAKSFYVVPRDVEFQVQPIGNPISCTQLLILNPQKKQCGINEIGEIVIRSPYRSGGYVTGLTFAENHFISTQNDKLYFTGDLGRCLPDGSIAILGRRDRQLKIRGVRIEPAEIEATISMIEVVKSVAVIGEEVEGELQLALYFVASEDAKSSGAVHDAINTTLDRELPSFKHPTLVKMLEKMPMLANGKIDYKKLTSSTYSLLQTGQSDCDDLDELGVQIRAIFVNVLPSISNFSSTASFFHMGGDSIRAVQIVNRIRRDFKIDIGIRDFFENNSVQKLSDFIRNSQVLDDVTVGSTVQHVRDENNLDMSSAQKRLWLLHEMNDKVGATYCINSAIKIDGEVDVSAAKAALYDLIERHETLRYNVKPGDDGGYFCLNNDVSADLNVKDFSHEIAPQNQADRWLEYRAADQIPLNGSSLFRACFAIVDQSTAVFSFSIHHIVSDAWSLNVLMGEFVKTYYANVKNQKADIPTPTAQYSDYVADEKNIDTDANAQKAHYWKQRLTGAPTTTSLPFDHKKNDVAPFSGDNLGFRIQAKVLEKMKSLAIQNGTTLYSVIYTGLSLLVSNYTASNEVVIGTAVSNRNKQRYENVAGFFVNTLAIRGAVDLEQCFGTHLQENHSKILSDLSQGDFPFDQVIDAVNPTRDPSIHPLFQTMLILHNIPNEMGGDYLGIKFSRHPVARPFSKYDLTFQLGEEHGDLVGFIEFNTSLYKTKSVQHFADNFVHILETVIKNPDCPIGKLDLISEAEKTEIAQANATDCDFGQFKSISNLILEKCLEVPDDVAIAFHGTLLTYRELDKRVAVVAQSLSEAISVDVLDKSVVAVSMDRSIEMIIAILAILRSGAIYLPVDPKLPEDRIRYILEDSNAIRIIADLNTHDHLVNICEAIDTSVISFHNLEESTKVMSRQNADWGQVDQSDLAYLIYTSGTTGAPKGVMVSQANIFNFFKAMDIAIPEPNGVWLAVTTISFDISILEVLWTLSRGYKIVLHTIVPPAENDIVFENDMDIGLFFFASGSEGDGIYDMLLHGANFADKNGLKRIWTPERHFNKFGGIFPNPSVVSAAIAAQTKNIQINSGSVVLPLHSTLRVAEEWSVVDNLSNGRIGLALTSGWHADDFVLNPSNYEDRKNAFDTGIKDLQSLFAGKKIIKENGLGKRIEVEVFPKPIQKNIPLWVTCSGNPETFRKAGSKGLNVLTHMIGQDIGALTENIKIYRNALSENGFEGDGYVSLMIHTFIGADDETVKETVRDPFKNYLRDAVGLVRNLAASMDLNYDTLSEAELDSLLNHAFERYSDSCALFGTAQTCMKLAKDLYEAGVSELACLVDFGIPQDVIKSNLGNLGQFQKLLELGQKKNEPESIRSLIKRHNVTHMQCTPSLMRILLDEAEIDAQSSLKNIYLGGEALEPALYKRLKSQTDVNVFNMYGPTETTIWSSVQNLNDIKFDRSYIGKPIANTNFYVVGANNQRVPIGAIGELLIGGDGVAIGYKDKPELTDKKFVTNLFHEASNEKLYRTGDLVRLCSNGIFEYIGRSDSQVKVNGHRIELGEVETALVDCVGVKSAAAIKITKGNNEAISAYVVMDAGTPDEDAISTELSSRLPAYMLPSFITFLDELPLNSNGKIDRNKLPEPAFTPKRQEDTANFSDTLRAIIVAFENILGIEDINSTDDFFLMGGNSLATLKLKKELKSVGGIEISIDQIFTGRTPARIENLFMKRQGFSQDRVQIVQYNQAARGKPLFILQRLGGVSIAYKSLADCIPDTPVFVLGGPSLDSSIALEYDVNKLANLYSDKIKTIQPEGEISILGWSYGGVVSYLSAQILEAAGRNIRNIIFIDSVIPKHSSVISDDIVAATIGRDFLLPEDVIDDVLDQSDLKAKKGKLHAVLSENQLLDEDIDVAQFSNYFDRFKSHLTGMAIDKPKREKLAKVNATVVHAHSEKTDWKTNYATWGAYFTQAPQTVVVDSDHYSILQKPDLDKWFTQLDWQA